MDIEKLATSAITDCIAGTDFLSPWISEGDREPSWDGFIYAYSHRSHAKKYMTGRAAVQIKGKLVKNVKKKGIQYPVSMTDLENYRNDGGILFFVVAITSELQKKIYYSVLLPYKINQLMEIYRGKKRPSLTFAEFPTKKNDIENIVINFVKDSRKQAVAQNGKNWTINEVVQLVGFENFRLNFSVTCIGYDRNDPFTYLKNNEFYMYAGNKDNTLQFPVEHIENLEIITCNRDAEIAANNKVFYDYIRTEQHRNGTRIIYIGKCIRMILEENKNITFKYTLQGDLDERLCAVEFMTAIYEEKGFFLEGKKIGFDFTRQKMDIEALKKQLQYLRLIKEMLDRFEVKKSLDMDNLTSKDEDYIRMLINTQLYGTRASFKGKEEIPWAGFINISNIHLGVIFTRMGDGTYMVEDFFHKEIACSSDKSQRAATSQYVLLSIENYLEADNFNGEIVEKSFKKYHNASHYLKTNFSILNMLHAYDRDNKRLDLLRLAESLCEWLIIEQPNDYIYQINLMQCHKRRNDLTDQEVVVLNEISKKEANNIFLQVGIQILLDNNRLAKIYLQKLSENERKEYETYPIYRFMRQKT